ncbi:MAG: ATP-binding cassette domain-containing protein, partial [Thermoleophilia bacterium]
MRTARDSGVGKESASAGFGGGRLGSDLAGGFGDRPALEFRSVRKSFPGVTAVDDVSFSLRFGEIHCLLGENGAGKTSLLNIAAGIYRPDAGVVVAEGRSVSISSPAAAREAGIATVRQHPALVLGNTVAENLLLGRPASSRLDRRGAAAALAA